MANNFDNPQFLTYNTQASVTGPDRIQFDLPVYFTPAAGLYSVGYVQMMYEIKAECSAGENANIGKVLNESTTERSYFGTLHTERDSYVMERRKIEYPNQLITIKGEKYPFTRNEAAEPKFIRPSGNQILQFTNTSNVPLQVVPESLSLRVEQIDRPDNIPVDVVNRSIPVYRIEQNCLGLELNGYDLSFVSTPGYFQQTIDNLVLGFDPTTIVVRPFPLVTIQLQVAAYMIIASEEVGVTTQIQTGDGQGGCLPNYPIYPPIAPAPAQG